MIHLEVVGIPQPQGNHTGYNAGGHIKIVEGRTPKARRAFKDWREAVATAARDYVEAHPMSPLAEPVRVDMAFRFPTVKSDPYRHHHTTKPDLDKLTRAVLDSLKFGGLLKDDSLVASLCASKLYAVAGQSVGCTVLVDPLGDDEAAARDSLKAAAALIRNGRAIAAKASPTQEVLV